MFKGLLALSLFAFGVCSMIVSHFEIDNTVRVIQSIESAIYFVGSVLVYLLLNTNKVQGGQNNGRN